MRIYWRSKEHATVQYLGRHMTSLIKLQIGLRNTNAPQHEEQTEIWRWNNESREAYAKSIESNVIFWWNCLAIILHPRSPYTTMPIWRQQHQHPQQLQQAPRSFWTPSSTPSIDDMPYFWFCLSLNHTFMHCTSLPPVIHTTLISTRNVNLSSMPRCSGWLQKNSYRNHSLQRNGPFTTNTELSINA